MAGDFTLSQVSSAEHTFSQLAREYLVWLWQMVVGY